MNTETFQLNFQSVAVIAIILSVISLIFVGVALIGPFEGQCEELKKKKTLYRRIVCFAAVSDYNGRCVLFWNLCYIRMDGKCLECNFSGGLVV